MIFNEELYGFRGSAQFILSGWLPAGPTGRHIGGELGNFVFGHHIRRHRRKGVNFTPLFVLKNIYLCIYR